MCDLLYRENLTNNMEVVTGRNNDLLEKGVNNWLVFFFFSLQQGDFLLIVLKNLIEKQSAHGAPKLKIVLMYAILYFVVLYNYA